ncbi:MAG TPA: DUF5642 family protein [Mycobacterium sp.]|nr:DUF5642 family protein [Mycobacterium sp.]
MATSIKLPALLCVALVSACSSAANYEPVADIAKVADLKSSFGPEFKVTEVPVTGIDPKMLAAQKMPEGMTFDPADCAKFAAGQTMPSDVKGNMAGLSAEGDGNRFVTIAMETSAPIPLVAPGDNCDKVSFSSGAVRGTVEVVPVPQIAGVATLGVHRILQATIDKVPQTGQIYSYRAQFGNYQVIVTANPLVAPDKPVAPVDSKRAVDLLTAAVAAIKRSR